MQAHPHHPDHHYLKKLLSERNQYPERAPEIDAIVHKSFGRIVAILAMDMCGFSRLTAKYGILHFMAMIHQMETAARPAIEANGGKVLKVEADNIYAIFAEPAQALEAALDIFRAFDAMNAVLPEDRDIYGSIGIGYGESIVIEERDAFGCEMNFACKLGEDLAEKMEILLTPAAFAALPPDRYIFKPKSFTISGVTIDSHSYDKSLFPRVPPESANTPPNVGILLPVPDMQKHG